MPCNCLWILQEKDISGSLVGNEMNAKNKHPITSVASQLPPRPKGPTLVCEEPFERLSTWPKASLGQESSVGTECQNTGHREGPEAEHGREGTPPQGCPAHGAQERGWPEPTCTAPGGPWGWGLKGRRGQRGAVSVPAGPQPLALGQHPTRRGKQAAQPWPNG